jgi:type III secretion system YscI/HrpB-like protein
MIESVLAQTAASAGATVSAPPALRVQALGADVDRFAAAMNDPQGLVMPPSDRVPSTLGADKPGLGDAILTGLKSASDDLGQRFTHAQTMLSGPELGVADAMRLQLSIMQASMQYELINKGVSKMTQNIDQVLKTQ